MNYRFPMNSTDKYPPFTLASRPDYPGDLEVDYPERLTNWAVLVKWWLLAIPQILLCWAMEPLLQVLTVIAAVALLCTGTIPQGMFDLLMGIVRWRYRVAVYVSLMRDEYPPFRHGSGWHDRRADNPLFPYVYRFGQPIFDRLFYNRYRRAAIAQCDRPAADGRASDRGPT